MDKEIFQDKEETIALEVRVEIHLLMVPMVIPFPSVWVTSKVNTSTQSKAIPGLISIATKLPIVIILEPSHRLM